MCQSLLGIAGKFFAPCHLGEYCSEGTIEGSRLRQPAVEQDVGDAGLLLDAVGKSRIFRLDIPDIDNQIGVKRHDLRCRRRIAATRDAAGDGQGGVACGE